VNLLYCFLLAVLGLVSCATPPKEKTSLEIQAIQSREFEADKRTSFNSTVSVFQDMGFTIVSADYDTGFISTKSPTKARDVFLGGNEMKSSKATAFVEEIGPNKSSVRINFVHETAESNEGTQKNEDLADLDPSIYERTFSKIQEAIFIRTANHH
jgi:hypothetical protein